MTSRTVLQVNKFATPHVGGIEKYVQLLSEQLVAARTWQVRVLVCNSHLSTSTSYDQGIQTTRVASMGVLFSMPIAPTFPFWLRKQQGDIVHFHHPFPLGELSALAARGRPRMVVTWHSDIIGRDWFMRTFRGLNARYMNRVDRILVTSPNYLQFSKTLHEFRDKCRVIPLGIDCDRFRPNERILIEADRLKASIGKPLLLFVGRLVPYKGLPTLLEAMRGLPSAHLAIVGEGPEEGRLRAAGKRMGVESRISFHRGVSDTELISYYHACDVLVLPSCEVKETFGLVQVEAMACGKPVVSTALPTGVPFVNEDGKSGLVVPPLNADALRTAIQTLISNPQMRQDFGQYGIERSRSLFDIRVSARLVQECYGELLSS